MKIKILAEENPVLADGDYQGFHHLTKVVFHTPTHAVSYLTDFNSDNGAECTVTVQGGALVSPPPSKEEGWDLAFTKIKALPDGTYKGNWTQNIASFDVGGEIFEGFVETNKSGYSAPVDILVEGGKIKKLSVVDTESMEIAEPQCSIERDLQVLDELVVDLDQPIAWLDHQVFNQAHLDSLPLDGPNVIQLEDGQVVIPATHPVKTPVWLKLYQDTGDTNQSQRHVPCTVIRAFIRGNYVDYDVAFRVQPDLYVSLKVDAFFLTDVVPQFDSVSSEFPIGNSSILDVLVSLNARPKFDIHWMSTEFKNTAKPMM
jgi:hypothetical protein